MEVTIASTRAEISEPTMNLRWGKNGNLQQQFTVNEYDLGKLVDGRYEWRDVPTEQ